MSINCDMGCCALYCILLLFYLLHFCCSYILQIPSPGHYPLGSWKSIQPVKKYHSNKLQSCLGKQCRYLVHVSYKCATFFWYQSVVLNKTLHMTLKLATKWLLIFAARCYASAAYVVMRCLSVCPSVTFVSCVKMNKRIKKFSPSGSHAILVFPCQMVQQYSNGNP